jgi:hypothetical protein
MNNKKIICSIYQVTIPPNIDEDHFIRMMTEYLMLNRFVEGEVKTNAYPADYNLQITPLITPGRNM